MDLNRDIMKQLTLITLFLSLFILNVHANEDNPPARGTLTGNVIDAASQEPLPYVNVVVRNSQDSILTGGITDDAGNFTIRDVPAGNM